MENWRKRWERFMFTEDMIVGGGTVLNPKPETYSDFVRMLDDIENFISQELDKAREEVLLELLEKKTNYKIEEVGHGYKVTQEYVLVSDIEKELSKLTTK